MTFPMCMLKPGNSQFFTLFQLHIDFYRFVKFCAASPTYIVSECLFTAGCFNQIDLHVSRYFISLLMPTQRAQFPYPLFRSDQQHFQVAGLPTNIDFLLKLANHGAFENGEVETHFIELHKDDLFIDSNNSLSTQKACNAAVHSAAIAAICVCEKEHAAVKERSPGNVLGQLLCMSTLSTFWKHYLYNLSQVTFLYGILIRPSESIIVPSVSQNLNGMMSPAMLD